MFSCFDKKSFFRGNISVLKKVNLNPNWFNVIIVHILFDILFMCFIYFFRINHASLSVQSRCSIRLDNFNFKIMLPVVLKYNITNQLITIEHNYIKYSYSYMFPMVLSSGWLLEHIKGGIHTA